MAIKTYTPIELLELNKNEIKLLSNGIKTIEEYLLLREVFTKIEKQLKERKL